MKIISGFKSLINYWNQEYRKTGYSDSGQLYRELKERIEKKTIFNLVRYVLFIIVGAIMIFMGEKFQTGGYLYVGMAVLFYLNDQRETYLYLILRDMHEKDNKTTQ